MTRLLFDTHLLLWVVTGSPSLPVAVRQLLEAGDDTVFFSVASIHEVAIKHSLGRPDFRIDPALLRNTLLADGYEELPIMGTHAVGVRGLPPASQSPNGHKDPFDRLLIAQAAAENMDLVTSDAAVAAYSGTIRYFPKAA